MLERTAERRAFRRIERDELPALLPTPCRPPRRTPSAERRRVDDRPRRPTRSLPAHRVRRPRELPVACSAMERRIFGLENEYGVTCTLRGQRRLSPDEVARYLFRRVVSWGRSSNVFLANGARLYLDVGSHPEYATPECDSIHDLVVHDKAGERILEQLLASAEQRLAEEGIRGDIYLFKNNTDSAGNSYGCHENYLTSRRDDFAPLRRGADPVPRHPPDLRRGRQGPADRPGRHVLHLPAGRAHLGGRVVGDHPQPAHHQHPRRAPRRRRALPPPPRDRGRLQHERVRHLPQGRHHRDPAAHARGAQRGAARHDPREPDPGHPRDQPRHHLHAARCAWPTAGRPRPSRSRASTSTGPSATPSAATSRRSRSRRSSMWEHGLTQIEKDPLGLDREADWVIKYKPDRGLPREARPAPQPPEGGAARPPVPRRQPRAGRVLQDAAPGPGRADLRRRRDRRGRRHTRPRPPGPACGASSSVGPRSASATTPSTGCT